MVYVKRVHMDMPSMVTEVARFEDADKAGAEQLAQTRQDRAGASEVYWASNVPAGVVGFITTATDSLYAASL
jgi:hypothetical protein